MSGNLGEELKVVLLCDEWGSSKGGLSTFNRQLAAQLAKRSDLVVSCFLPEVSDKDKNAASKDKVILIEADPIPGNRDPLVKLQQWPTEQPFPDVIISHGRKFGPAACLIKRYLRCKWVHFVHVDCKEMGKNKDGSNEIGANNKKDSDELSLCKSADVVVAVGPQLLKRYRKSLSSEKKPVEVFYPGLSSEFKIPDPNCESNESDEFFVYIFGRCSIEDFELKGFDLAAKAVGELGEGYNLNIVGVAEGEEKNIQQYTLDTTELRKSQLFLQAYCKCREEMRRIMCEADLVVMPSRAEAFGLIGLEALSAGVPLLVSSHSGLGMTLKELKFGHCCVVESDDPQEWAKKIKSVKERKRSQRIEEIKQIRNHYEEKYNWDEECSRLVKLFLDD